MLNLSDIDEVLERFHVDGYLFMRWVDPRLRHAPTDKRFYKVGDIWIPTLEVVNGIGHRQRDDVHLSVDSEGAVRYTERFSATVSSRFTLPRFPFDSQVLLIVIHPFVGDARVVNSVPDLSRTTTATTFRTYSSLASWDVESLETQVGRVIMSNGGTMPDLRFELHVKRRFEFYLWKVFLPLGLMVFLSWTSSGSNRRTSTIRSRSRS